MMDEVTTQRKLLESLYIMTSKGLVNWTYDKFNDSCEANIGDGYIQIANETDEEGDYLPVVRVLNAEKDTIDRITGGYELGQLKPLHTGHDNYWRLVSDLQRRAEKNAKGADQVLNSILNSLDADTLDFSKNDKSDNIPF